MVVNPGTLSPDVVVASPSVTEIAAENAKLRAEVLAENAKLKAALDASQASGLTFQGLTDEDVRRLEHPEEFEHEQLLAQLQDMQTRARAEGVSLDGTGLTAATVPGDIGPSLVDPVTGATLTDASGNIVGTDPRDQEIADLRAQLGAARQDEIDEDAGRVAP